MSIGVPVRDGGPSPSFRADLAAIINRHSRENASGTPDYILAKYLSDCLVAFDRATQHRAEWLSDDGVTTREFLVDR